MNKQQDALYDPVPATTMAQWPPGTFPGNLAAAPDGSWLVTFLSHNRIDRVYPDGTITVFATLPATPMGIVVVQDDAYVVSGSIGHENWRLYRISLAHTGAELVCKLPHLRTGNGMAASGRHLFVVDSFEGTITRINPENGESAVWIEDELLKSPYETIPGVNGIVVEQDDAYLSNTGRSLILHTPLIFPNLSIVADHVVADDFDRHPDGSFYVATYLHDSVVQIRPDGSRRDIARTLENTTAVAIDPENSDFVWVTAAGEKTTPARLVRLQVNG
ncbi:SMP-30/gluconolactonase/LRE family protein [Cryptosporangium sp. NPDC048952]|uniref:SMP-30/gluconolactonase/LRE family protein n=1 Tax=Cryptosporangium sp. NPDC048952 TaxID=3363961 RepID=UPI00371CA4CA